MMPASPSNTNFSERIENGIMLASVSSSKGFSVQPASVTARHSSHHMKQSSLKALERIYCGATPQVRRKLQLLTANSTKNNTNRPMSSARTVIEEKANGLTGSESNALLSTKMQTTDAASFS